MTVSNRRGAGRRLLARLVSAALLAAACGAVLAEDDEDDGTCLRVLPPAADGRVLLRVGMPPSDANGTAPLLGAIIGRAAGRPGQAGAHNGATLTRLALDGAADLLAGRLDAAASTLAACREQALQQGDSLAAAGCAGNLGLALALQGRHDQARQALEQALQQLDVPRQPPPALPPSAAEQAVAGQQAALLQRGLAGLPPAQRAQAEAALRAQLSPDAPAMQAARLQAWRDNDQLQTVRSRERTLLNLGHLALATGRLAEAEALLRRATTQRLPGEDSGCRRAADADLAGLLRRIGNRGRSAPAGTPASSGQASEAAYTLFEMGTVQLAMATAADGARLRDSAAPAAPPTTPAPSSAAPTLAPSAPVAAAPLQRATLPPTAEVQLWQEPASRLSADALAQLSAQAAAAGADEQPWRRIALRAAAGQRADLGFAAHSRLMRLRQAAGDVPAAIFHGKQAVGLAQAARARLADGSATREARRAFLRDRRQVYIVLAQLLLDTRRLAEAEQVLQLLREDEGQQVFDAPRADAPPALALSPAETTLARADAEAATNLRRIELQRLEGVARMPVAGNGLLMLQLAQIEQQRLRLALDIADLPARLQAARPEGLNPVLDIRPLATDLRDFFTGPGQRLEQFLQRLTEDLPQFSQPVAAAERQRLADTQRNAAGLRAALAPLLAPGAFVEPNARAGGGGGRFTALSGYLAAEPLQSLWRGDRAAAEAEARQLREAAPREARLAAAPASAATADARTALLAAQPMATVLLYYLPDGDRLDMLLVGAAGRQHWRLAVPQATLERQVRSFVRLLQAAARDARPADPRPEAHRLHDLLVAPVAAALARADAKLVVLSLAGPLRFLPFAALHDGRGWLVERHALALHPGSALEQRLRPASPHWRAVAFGATQAATVGASDFPALPSVRGEIEAIVRAPGAPGAPPGRGLLPGEAWLDRDFSAEQLRTALAAGPQLVHIAAHFQFAGGDPQASYLVLGDGRPLSLQALAGPAYRLDRSELVTLSACSSALSDDDVYGQEVDGLAALLMGQGAPSVLATLWNVSDSSTAQLMTTLYRVREDRALPRALALQQAQLALIRSAADDGDDDGAAAQAAGGLVLDRPGEAGARARSPAPAVAGPPPQGRAHPFHWAGVVLMGNWR